MEVRCRGLDEGTTARTVREETHPGNHFPCDRDFTITSSLSSSSPDFMERKPKENTL